MKKTALLLTVLSAFFLFSCTTVEEKVLTPDEVTTDLSVEINDEANDEVLEENIEAVELERISFKDEEWGFEISFPGEWKNVNKQPLTDSTYALYSNDFLERNITLQRVDNNKNEAVSVLPGQESFFLGKKDSFYYYLLVDNWVGINPDYTVEDLENLLKEVQSVVPTFIAL